MKYLVVIVICLAVSLCQDISYSSESKNMVVLSYPVAEGAKYKWYLDRVVNLPNGKPLPDFYYDFMTVIASNDYCKVSRRDLMSPLPEEEMKQITPEIANGLKTGIKPTGMTDSQNTLYDKLNVALMFLPPGEKTQYQTQIDEYMKQNSISTETLPTDISTLPTDISTLPTDISTLPTDISTLQTGIIPAGTTLPTTPTTLPSPEKIVVEQKSSTSVIPTFDTSTSNIALDPLNIGGVSVDKSNINNLSIQSSDLVVNLNKQVEIPDSVMKQAPSIIKEVSKRLEFLKQSLSDQDIKAVQDMVRFNGTLTNQLQATNFKNGFAYYFRLEITTADVVLNKTYTYVHTDLDLDNIREIPNFQIQLSNFCQRQFEPLKIQFDLTNSPLKDVQIDSVKIEVAPFFQFANEDVCVESLGWRLKSRRTFAPGDDPLIQNFTFPSIPFTPQDTLSAYVQVTYTLKNSTQFVGLTVFTVKGMVLQAGQLLKQLKASDQLKVLAFLVSIKETTGNTIDLDKIDLDDLLVIADQLGKLTNIQDLSSNDPGLVLVQGVLKKCNSSFSWMVQMLQQQFAKDKKPVGDKCQQSENSCGNNGICQKKPATDSEYFCSCTQGFAGGQCQYQESEYQALLSGQKQLMDKLAKLTSEQPDTKATLNRITQLADQPVLDKDAAQELQKLIQNCVRQAETIDDINKLIYGLERLKQAYQQMALNDEDRQQYMGSLGRIIEDIVKKSARLLFSLTGDKQLSFNQVQVAGQITKIDQSTTSINLQMDQTIINPQSQLYFPSPSATLEGLDKAQLQSAKAVVFQIQQCEFQGLTECNAPMLRISFVDNDGLDVVPAKAEGVIFKFTLPITELTQGLILPLSKSTLDVCAWIDELTNTLKKDGCVSKGVQDGLLQCECTHLTRFIAAPSGQFNVDITPTLQASNTQSQAGSKPTTVAAIFLAINIILVLIIALFV